MINGDKDEGDEKEAVGINPFKVEGEDDEDEDGSSDEDDRGFETSGFEDNFDGGVGVSLTREAERRTSLEDEDEDDSGAGGVGMKGDDEVVHVAMVEEESDSGSGSESKHSKIDKLSVRETDDGELVHIQHAETQGKKE